MSEQRGAEMRNYKLVQCSTTTGLESLVSSMRDSGWECSGAPHWHENERAWVQAMVRKPDIPGRLREPKRA